jgi:hypothetical protein
LLLQVFGFVRDTDYVEKVKELDDSQLVATPTTEFHERIKKKVAYKVRKDKESMLGHIQRIINANSVCLIHFSFFVCICINSIIFGILSLMSKRVVHFLVK